MSKIFHTQAKKGDLAFFLFLLLCGFVVWNTIDALLLFFAATLISTFLSHLTRLVHSAIPKISEMAALLLVLLAIVLFFGLFVLLLAPSLYEQFGLLVTELPKAIDKIELWARNQSWLLEQTEDVQWSSAVSNMLSKAGSIAFATFNGLTGIGLACILGIFFALNPKTYINGILLLFPKNQHKRVERIFTKGSNTLWLWLLGRGVSMLSVAVLTTAGLLFLDMPLALVLGLLAGLLSFIPNFGPIFSIIPAALVGVTQDPSYLYTIPLLYIVVQIVEGNFITPFVQQNMAKIPAGVVIMSQVLFTMLFGFLGLLMATPLAVISFIVIKEFYVKDVLGNATK